MTNNSHPTPILPSIWQALTPSEKRQVVGLGLRLLVLTAQKTYVTRKVGAREAWRPRLPWNAPIERQKAAFVAVVLTGTIDRTIAHRNAMDLHKVERRMKKLVARFSLLKPLEETADRA